MRVVASLTTIPGRYHKLIKTLRSIKNQDHPLDEIYLSIPRECRRLKKPYPDLPDEIKELCTVVTCEEDYGPCTKIVAGLLCESDPNTIIFTFDDDVIYSPNLVSSMLEYNRKYPNCAIGSTGTIIGGGFPFYSMIHNLKGNCNTYTGFEIKEARKVDILFGVSSVLYLRGFFPDKELLYDNFLKYPLEDEDVYFNDDIMISAYLSNKVDRIVVDKIPMVNENNTEVNILDGNEISYDKIKFLKRFIRAIYKTQGWGFYKTTQEVAIYETIGGRLLILILFILVIIISILA